MLQSEAGYIDARPHVRQIDETLLQRTAGPYIGVKTRSYRTATCAPASPRTADMLLERLSRCHTQITCVDLAFAVRVQKTPCSLEKIPCSVVTLVATEARQLLPRG